MAIEMPDINLTFQQLATSLVDRSERGIAIIIITDETSGAISSAKYADITELEADKDKYTTTNYQYLEDVFSYALNEVVVVNRGASGTVTEALTTVEKIVSTGWITITDGVQADFDTLASWIKTKEALKKTYKAVCYKATTTDCKHIVNFYNDKVTFIDSDGRGEVTGEKVTPLLVGVLASCNVLRGSTYYQISKLKSVEEVADRDTAINSGKFVLFNDGDGVVRIAVGINSLVTTDGKTSTEDMKYIDNIEAQDLMLDDITSTFKTYIGGKNKLDNQMLFIAAVNGYFKTIAKSDVLDSEYANTASINVEAQRQAWVDSGKSEASTWDDAYVKKMTFKRSLFLKGDVKILGSIENLNFDISLV